ncbi:MAG: carbohydrate ABC transporter permease [Lachnospiraceae bacterium]|nr:carbohydrate ABC transporter permease [Lachnospiraceae bacterium]MBQ6545632.1 carbohydrate ABC transporter permease [Lachnospiraceae bacterium]
MKNNKYSRNYVSIPSTILVILLLVWVMVPFYIMFFASFKPNFSILRLPPDLVPLKDFTLVNYKAVFERADVFLWMKNSFIISVSVALATAFIAVTAGYAFAKIKFPGKNVFFALVMATLMMPKQMLLIPNYLVAYNLHLQDSFHGVILTTIAPAFGVFLSRQYITSLPSTLFDAAEIDGCSELGKFFRVALPLSLPAVGTISIFAFFTSFNDYLWQLIMLSNKKLMTMPVGLSFFGQTMHNNRAAQLALSSIGTIPLILIFIACQKFFIKGATVGAVKG